jgi:hypothetical protein
MRDATFVVGGKFMNWRFRCILGAMLASPLGRPSQAAELKPSMTREGRVIVSISGEIDVGDTEALKATIKVANNAGKLVSSLRLNSIGGNLLEGVKLAEVVKFAKMATNVGQGATCASACFLVFAAGETKFANYSAKIGVHGASDQTGEESGTATVSMARFAKELGVPPAIIGRMVVSPPSEMVWLSPADLQTMGTTMVGKPSQLPSIQDGPIAKQTQPAAPVQLQPGAPTQLQPEKTSAPVSWKTLVANAMEISSRQHGGKPETARSCQPEAYVCTTAIVLNVDGVDTAILARENAQGKIIEREICTFNDFSDIRTCMDFDSKLSHRDMKDSKGNWSKVADE